MLKKTGLLVLTLVACGLLFGNAPGIVLAQDASPFKLLSDDARPGYKFPESVAFHRQSFSFYVGEFGSELKPTEKDNQGKISLAGVFGEKQNDKVLPAGSAALNKPKGLWCAENRLWVADIDVVWVFDVQAKAGRKVDLPGAVFANDTAIWNGSLYVSDTGSKTIYKVHPADFLDAGVKPEVVKWMEGMPFSPNGLWPAKNGELLAVGYDFQGKDEGVYSIDAQKNIRTIADKIGQLDGVGQLFDDSIVFTDWKTGTLKRIAQSGEIQVMARDFQGPADFQVLTADDHFLVAVPDLVKGELRIVRFEK